MLLQCLHTLVTNVPRDMAFNEHFKRYVCTKLCPTLIALIDSTDNQRGSHVGTANNSTSNKASGFWKRKPSGLRMNESHMKIIILTFIDSADLLGPDPEMRPVLESLFHRLLLTSQPKERLMAVHHLKEVPTQQKSPKRWCDGDVQPFSLALTSFWHFTIRCYAWPSTIRPTVIRTSIRCRCSSCECPSGSSQ